MNEASWRTLASALLLSIGVAACGENDSPVKPENRSLIIFSVSVFPDSIGLADSTVVICNAMDPDADTLVYDWTTDDRLRLKGARPGDPFNYNTAENSQVFYPVFISSPADTIPIWCYARDRRGKGDSRLVHVVVGQ